MSETKSNDLIKRIKLTLGDNNTDLFIKLLDAKIDEWKDALVEAKDHSIPELQGAIKKVRSILVDLRRNTVRQERKPGAYDGA